MHSTWGTDSSHRSNRLLGELGLGCKGGTIGPDHVVPTTALTGGKTGGYNESGKQERRKDSENTG